MSMLERTSCCVSILDLAAPHAAEIDQLRRAAFRALRSGTPARLSELAAETGHDLSQVRDAVGQLVAAGVATVDGELGGDPLVVGAEGLTVAATSHRLLLEGKHLHTWCGFDTVGIPAALAVDAVAATTCPSCGGEIVLALPGGQPPASSVVGWWPQVSGPVNESFCPVAGLFCSQEHVTTWRAANLSSRGEALSLIELAERGRLTWSLFTEPGDTP